MADGIAEDPSRRRRLPAPRPISSRIERLSARERLTGPRWLASDPARLRIGRGAAGRAPRAPGSTSDGRGADEDPHQVPARARERGLGRRCPSPAYAKGFLRTYAQLLGLDARGARRRVPPPGRERAAPGPLPARRARCSRRGGGPGTGDGTLEPRWLVAGASPRRSLVAAADRRDGGDDEGSSPRASDAKEQRKERKRRAAAARSGREAAGAGGTRGHGHSSR